MIDFNIPITFNLYVFKFQYQSTFDKKKASKLCKNIFLAPCSSCDTIYVYKAARLSARLSYLKKKNISRSLNQQRSFYSVLKEKGKNYYPRWYIFRTRNFF